MKRIIGLTLLVVMGVIIIVGLDRYYCESEYRENLFHLNRFAERVEYVLTRSIPDKLGVVEDLKSFLLASETQNNPVAFDQYAAWVLSRNPTLDWLGYADQTQVIQNIYPLAGNDTTLYVDLNTRPEDIPWVQRAIVTQRTILAPPAQSIQGFNAVTAYAPIVKENVFQGLAIGQFRLDKVIDYALIDLIRENPNYFVVLTDTTGHILWSSHSQSLDSSTIRLVFPVGEAEWIAYVGWRHSPQPDPIARQLLWACGGMIVILLFIIFNGMLTRNNWLSKTVQDKTAELALRNIKLTEEITERIKAEEEQKRAVAAMLEAKEAWARTEKLASLGTMAAGLAHEINQPLNSIKVMSTGIIYAHNMGKERSASEMIQAMKEISQQADRINNIISHMRAFIRQDSSQIVPADWNTAVEQSLKIVGKQLAAHGITVCKTLAPDLPLILASPTALEEIIVNLLVNAMQALDTVTHDHKTATIRTFYDGEVVLEITDNGPGIAKENKEKIFVPFFSTKNDSENHGLGLSIVHTIATSYQGKVQLLESASQGAGFRIIIPACK